MVKLQFDSNKQFKITLPKQILVAKGWNKGDEIKIQLDEQGNLILKKEEKGRKR
ncbi:hypothetical protein J4410_01820 [Candidatus Woesearchaeota archaeon]|nr:hypothetical protein [Candidatus Woesearchaeota archaeon]